MKSQVASFQYTQSTNQIIETVGAGMWVIQVTHVLTQGRENYSIEFTASIFSLLQGIFMFVLLACQPQKEQRQFNTFSATCMCHYTP